MNVRESKREWVRELDTQGKSIEEIMSITGLKKKTVENYRKNSKQQYSGNLCKKSVETKLTPEEQTEWDDAVNRIRKACGKEPL